MNIQNTYHALGIWLARKGKLAAAETAYRKVIECDPDHVGAHRQLAVVLDRQGRLDEAIEIAHRVVALGQDNPDFWNALGLLLTKADELAAAEAAYRQVIELHPGHLGAHRRLALVLDRQGSLREAIDVAREAIALAVDNPDVYRVLGTLLTKNGKPEEAEATYRKVIELDPDHLAAHRQLAVALDRQGRPGEAIEIARKAVALASDNPDAHYALGFLLAKNGKLEEAEAAFRLVIGLSPDHTGAYRQLATVLDRQFRLDEAISVARRAVARGSDNPDMHHVLGMLLTKSGELEEAEAASRKVIELDPGHWGAYQQLISVLDRLGRTIEAAEVLDSKTKRHTPPPAYSFRSELARLWECTEENPTAQTSGSWSWSWLAHGRPAHERRDWQRRVQWGRCSGTLIRHLILYNRGRREELDELVTLPDWSGVERRLQDGRGAILAGVHLGPPLVAVDTLTRSKLPYKIVTANIEYIYRMKSDDIISDFQNRNLLLLQLLRSLEENRIVYLAAEGQQGKQFKEFALHGREIKLPLGPPTLAYYARAATFWYAALWRDGHIVFDLQEGPTPNEAESLEQWRERWFAFFWKCFCKGLHSSPENLCRNLNLWRVSK